MDARRLRVEAVVGPAVRQRPGRVRDDLLSPGPFLDSLWAFTIFAAIIVQLTFVLSLLLAVLLNQITVARAFFRSAFFLPTACSYVVASLV